ncbi:rhodanese-like domain-containing protein [Paenibacillus popilliae]|uniref:Rhodanese-related sulfurtransferase n=1 Tax=Paenibacillus popilliae ATCC 14706 TaxID=1212764 RepID=M9LGG2_PAEPP|nr:rhodanese-like domain-containing protein [Paenibacillus popilliae]GAC41625.1 rhodanese-related sulfurtransferase [Paenibacillus popilliae ATCC 14706]
MTPIKTIEAAELRSRLQRGEALNIIDVREDEEVALGMIPGSKHIPMNQIPERLQEIEPTEEAIFICRSGYRSELVCEYLQRLGRVNAVNLEGGMLSWSVLESDD